MEFFIFSPRFFGFDDDTWFWTDWADSFNETPEVQGPMPLEEWVDQRSFYNPILGTNIDQYLLLALGAYIVYKLK